ncbi:MAG: hypothetical protein AAB389_00480 [Patescibacteria group bacterium]
MKNGRAVHALIEELIGFTNQDVLNWRIQQPSLFVSTFNGWKIEAEWENGDDPALYVDDKQIRGDMGQLQELHKAISAQLDRKDSGRKKKVEKLVQGLLKDIRKYKERQGAK